MNKHKLTNLLGGSVLFILLSVFVANFNAHADTDIVTPVDITVPVSCSLSSGGGSYNVTIANGTSDTVVANNITTSCNDTSGYAIYAIGFSNDKYASDASGNNNDMISSQNSSYNIQTNGTGTNSNWKMKLESITNASIENSFTSYQNIPATYTKVASYNTIVTTSTIKPTYQIYVGPDQQAGTYTGKVKYTLVHPHTEVPSQPQTTTTGKIQYYANVSDAVGTMNTQNVSSSVTLLPSNFSRTGYGFAGWSDKFDYATNPEAKFYGPMETITLNTADYTGTNPGLSLYAVWVKSQGNLQDSTKVASVCSSLTQAPIDGTANLASVSALTDQRDNNTYAIAKLADNKCWMIENMRLDNTNSDNSTGALAQGYAPNATYGNFAGLANSEDPWANNFTTANSLYSTDGSNNTTNIGTTNAGYRFPRYNNQNTTSRASAPATIDNNIYSYGNYYTWAAAIADLNNYTSNNASVTSTSICPTGWHLPTGGRAYASGDTSGVNVTGDSTTFREFYNLGYKTMGEVKTAYEDTPNSGYAYYSSNTTNSAGKTATAAFRSFPNNFLRSGNVSSGSVGSRGSVGFYWSSTASSSSSAYYLDLNSSNVYPGTNDRYKYNGRTIRCLVGS